jgi:hypothetical protein
MKALRPFFLALATVAAALPFLAHGRDDFERPPINYSASHPRDVVVQLEARIASGELQFEGSELEVLRAILDELQIPVESQMLVFSKTSLQRNLIRPNQPRAIYFSDDCYVGWVPGGLIEIASIDPELGPIFYHFNSRPAQRISQPQFVRDRDCLRCHGGSLVRGVPGIVARSVFTDNTGEMLLRHGTEVVDFRTPFELRWGGWYVTGRHGDALHRGNVLAQEKNGEVMADLTRGANITDLSPFFETENYLTDSSDIVALLVFEHQLAMHNTLTRAAFNVRRMIEYQRNLQLDLKQAVTDEPAFDSVQRVFDNATQEIVDHLLFKDEAPLPADIKGRPAFQETFMANVPRARDGSSLKELRLQRHIFRNRCSYVIYSEFFLALPDPLKARIYNRLAKALDPVDSDPRYAHLGTVERRRIANILLQTHPEFPRHWPAE